MGSFAILDLTSPWFWIAAAIVLLLLIALVLKFFVYGVVWR
jgi:ABC-type phosphate transport system auxiliary subunit